MLLPIFEDIPLADLNTLRLPARAERYAEIHSPEQLIKLIERGDLATQRVFILGGGSNIVLKGDLNAFVLHMRIPGHMLATELDDAWIVRAGAGENWHEFVRWTLDQGWGGLENLSLIPGTVGAAPIQNIGAYGVELADRFFALEAVDLRSGRIISFDKDACQFAYRDSLFKQQGAAGRFVITAVSFRLPKDWQPVTSYADVASYLEQNGIDAPTPRDISDAVIAIRSRKLPDPAKLPNAGSFFKNPVVTQAQFDALVRDWPQLANNPQPDGTVKLSAGWLIERAGWKGRNLGPVGMYEKQALVLVNHGDGKGEDVLRLAAEVTAAVEGMFGVRLEQEPVLV
ncbi:UDP-N-acetylmuramate dehydrogenase [Viridibacterium curvum]|uniref:UDP-N-acetylenolpyruvoylglucosamine reductase n=1 Tax=Viridibacterium curvum TaxID=1101404 RepID=A0ABP9QTJ3_9RHOO